MASSATPSSRRWPSIGMGFSGNRGKSPGKYSAHVADAGRHAGAGRHPRQPKTQVPRGATMGSRLRACEKIAGERNSGPQRRPREGGGPSKSLFQHREWIPAFAGMTLRVAMHNPDFLTRSFAGNDAAVPLLTPYMQQSRTIARTFAPVTFSGKRASYCSGTTDDRRASLRLLFADISVAGREQWSSHRNICAIQLPDGSDTRNGHTVIRQIAETARARGSGKRLTRRRNSRSRGMPSVSIELSIGCSFPATAVHFAGHAYIRATHI